MATMPFTDWMDSFLIGGRAMVTKEFTEEWQENDGVVNTISMRKCARGGYVEYNGVARRGVWNGMPTIENTSHIAVVGHTMQSKGGAVLALFGGHAKLLYALPVSGLQHKDAVATVANPRTERSLWNFFS